MSLVGAASSESVSTASTNKKLSYRRGTARCVVSIEIDASWPTEAEPCPPVRPRPVSYPVS